MPETGIWRYRGQTIDREQIAFLREFIREHPHSSRWKLSRQMCEALGWKQANGALRDVVCRGLMLMLQRAGEIELPPVRRRIPGQRRTARPRPEAVLIDTTPLKMPLGALGAIEIQLVRRTADEPLFESLMEEFHYLRYEQPVGEHLKYLVWAQGRPVACLAWSSAPRHLASRDRFIGWSGEARRRNIRYLAYNTRFLILPWVEVPHLASHILGRMARQISRGLGAHLRAPDLFAGNLHRSGAIPRDLLSGGELGIAGADHGARQRRSDPSAEPVDQRSVGTSTPSPVSRVTAEHVSEYEARATRCHQ